VLGGHGDLDHPHPSLTRDAVNAMTALGSECQLHGRLFDGKAQLLAGLSPVSRSLHVP
jgi:hypothetical protein